MTNEPRNSLSPRDMRCLGDWVLANHEAVYNDELTPAEAAARADLQVPFRVSEHDIKAAFSSVDITWLGSCGESPVANRDAEIAVMADTLLNLCHRCVLLTFDREATCWAERRTMMRDIRDHRPWTSNIPMSFDLPDNKGETP